MNDDIWRWRFKHSTPLELVRYAQDNPGSDMTKIALEELDKQLVEKFGEPKRASSLPSPQP